MVGLQRDVLDELGDRPAPLGRVVGGEIPPPDLGGWAGPRQREHAAEERRGVHRDPLEHQRTARVADEGRCGGVSRLVDGGVGEHQAHDVDRAVGGVVALEPAQRDRAAPVVGDDHHLAPQIEHLGEAHQVVDPVGQPPELARPFREAHVELIRSDDANVLGHR